MQRYPKRTYILGNSLSKEPIFCLCNPYIRDGGSVSFDKDMQKLYIYNSSILSYHLFYFLSYFYQNTMLDISLDVLVIQVIYAGFYCTESMWQPVTIYHLFYHFTILSVHHFIILPFYHFTI